jgi:hypothetical protein
MYNEMDKSSPLLLMKLITNFFTSSYDGLTDRLICMDVSCVYVHLFRWNIYIWMDG